MVVVAVAVRSRVPKTPQNQNHKELAQKKRGRRRRQEKLKYILLGRVGGAGI